MDAPAPSAGAGSQVVTQLEAPPAEASTSAAAAPAPAPSAEHLVLHLVPARRKKKKKGVQWAEDTVDNEALGRRSSKKCCVFHRARAFGEWSDGEDSDAECSECGPDGGAAAPPPPPPAAPA
jgi:protein phosphatase 1 regulatory subunit 11